MRLSRIFVDIELTLDSTVYLPPSRAHYVRDVLRLKSNQNISLFNGLDSSDYMARIHVEGKRVKAIIVSKHEKNNESPIQTTLIQAIGKFEQLDFLVQKATELGAQKLLLFNARRTQRLLKANQLEKKLARWRDIAISACEQCGRNLVPSISFSRDLPEVFSQLPASNRLLLDFNGQTFTTLKSSYNTAQEFHVLIGPEGGLTEQEINLANEAGFQSCVLGPRVLRMETAAISILGIIQHSFGDMI